MFLSCSSNPNAIRYKNGSIKETEGLTRDADAGEVEVSRLNHLETMGNTYVRSDMASE